MWVDNGIMSIVMNRFALGKKEKKQKLPKMSINRNLVHKWVHSYNGMQLVRINMIYTYRCRKIKLKTLFTTESKLLNSIRITFVECFKGYMYIWQWTLLAGNFNLIYLWLGELQLYSFNFFPWTYTTFIIWNRS